MNLSFNYRPIFSRDRKELKDFIKEDSLWEDIYDAFLETKRVRGYNSKIPILKIFNEARYQCVRIIQDEYPESDIESNYLSDSSFQLDCDRQAAILCFSVVYTLLSLSGNPSRKFVRVCDELENVFSNEGYRIAISFYQLVQKQKVEGISCEIDLSPQPVSPDELDNVYGYKPERWREGSCDFDQQSIREIVFLWKQEEDRLKILERIESAFEYFENHSDDKDDSPLSCLYCCNSTRKKANKDFFIALWTEIENKKKKTVLLPPQENPELERLKSELEKTKQLLAEAKKRDKELIEEGERMLAEAREREEKLRAELDRQSVEAKNREREINNQWKKDLKELQKQMSGDNITQVFCHIATSYMKCNEKKSQGKREAIKTCLLEIVSLQKLQLPDDVNEAISNFDDENPQTTVVYKIGSYNPTIYKDQAQSNDVHFQGEIQLPESETKKLIEQTQNGKH